MKRKPPIWKRCCDTDTVIKRWGRKDVWRKTMTVSRAVHILRIVGPIIDADARAKINPSISQREMWEICWDAVAEHQPGTRINPLIAKNIGREFGRRWLRETGWIS